MTTARKKLIRRTLLNVFNQARPYLLAETVAFSALTLEVRPAPTQAEFDEVIKVMETDRVIVRIYTADEYKAKLTDEGAAELLQ